MVFGHYYLAREWVRMGHQVSILAASFAHTRFRQPKQKREIFKEVIDGINYYWLPTPSYQSGSAVGRIRSILSFSLKCFFIKGIHKADLVICSSHYPLAIYAAKRFARRSLSPLVFEVRDLWPLTLIELGKASRYNPFVLLLQAAEDHAYKHADCVVSVLPGAKEYMVSRGMIPEKFVYIPNGVNPEEQENNEALPDTLRQQLEFLKENGFFILGYAGKIGLSNALHILVEALALCRDPKIALVIVGSGAYANKIREVASRLGVSDNLFIFKPLEKAQVASFLNYLDVAYVGLPKKNIFRYGVSPTKINDFLLAGKPFISAIDGPGNAAEEGGAGVPCPAEDPQMLCKAILALKNTPRKDLEKMGQQGKDWVIKHRNYRILADSFLREVSARVLING